MNARVASILWCAACCVLLSGCDRQPTPAAPVILAGGEAGGATASGPLGLEAPPTESAEIVHADDVQPPPTAQADGPLAPSSMAAPPTSAAEIFPDGKSGIAPTDDIIQPWQVGRWTRSEDARIWAVELYTDLWLADGRWLSPEVAAELAWSQKGMLTGLYTVVPYPETMWVQLYFDAPNEYADYEFTYLLSLYLAR